ncbi:conserved hypothetical protein [Desulfamplus magnetovallimortis]|uniref:DUF4276 family protein n=1 Tax=Desulfamplus magnetovallimortis TaxID=1246637 RepID=A0A1W1HH71_9BACT|nr:DUF4276 family protein [Desulfamplus magnetovallimortis]SLM31790.1 conserved hypothetical protein [Desulfamplus magnetovallimortis]
MSDYIEIMIIAEGHTEKRFIDEILTPYMAAKNIFIRGQLVGKPGHKGGDIRFSRVEKDIAIHLKQRKDTFVSMFVDYYGIKKDWPGLNEARQCTSPKTIADAMNRATKKEVLSKFADHGADDRFIPFIAVHEFEALLFSDINILASQLKVDLSTFEKILEECGEPENINNSPNSAPSIRLKRIFNPYKKKTNGLTIANLTFCR